MALYSGGVMVASTSHACTSCSMMRLTRASILKACSSSSSAMHFVAARSSCSISFIHSSLVWCCTMNSISSCVGRQRVLRVRISSRCR
jgi:hypothetical protein